MPLTPTSSHAKSPTSSGDWTTDALRKSSRHKLSKIASLLSETERGLKAATTEKEKREWVKALNDLDVYSKTLGIERRIDMLTDKQMQLVEAWFDDQHAIVAAIGANRSSKTFGLAPAIALDIREVAPPGSLFLCVAKDSAQSARNQQKELWQLLPHHLLDTEWKGEKNGFGSERPMVIYDPGGRHIPILFMTQAQYDDNWRAFEAITAYRAWADESVSDGCFAAIGMRISTSDNAKLGLSSISDEPWIEDLRDRAEVDHSIKLVEFSVADNPVMNDEKMARQRLFASFGGDDLAAMRIEGESLVSGSRVFTEFEKRRHVISAREFIERTKGKDGEPDVSWYAGMDCGMDHLTVWLLVAVDREGTKYVVKEYADRNKSPAQDVAGILPLLGDKRLVWPTVADPAMWQNKKLGMEAMHYQQAGLPLSPAMRTQQFGEDYGVNILKDHLNGDRLLVCEECKTLIANFYKWRYKRDREGNALGMDKYQDKENDAIDALRYLMTRQPRYANDTRRAAAIAYDD